MAVRIAPLENGSFIVTFDSVEDREPECTGYRIFLKTKKGNFSLVAAPVKAQWKKEYSLKIFIDDKITPLLPEGQITIEVVPIIKKKDGKEVASRFVSIGELMQPPYLRQKFIKRSA